MEPTEDAASCSSKQPFAVRDVPGKGKGLVATQDIARGTRILCEEPLLRIINPRKYEGIVAGGRIKQPGRGVSVPSSKVLDPRKRFDLLALHNPFVHVPSMKYLGVINLDRNIALGINNAVAVVDDIKVKVASRRRTSG